MMETVGYNVDWEKAESIWNYSFSFITNAPRMAEHYHHCYMVVISLDNFFECEIDGQILRGLKGLVVNQTIPHSIDSADATLLINFIESESVVGGKMKELLDEKAWVNFTSVVNVHDNVRRLSESHKQLSDKEIILHVNLFLNSVISSDRSSDSVIPDYRVQRALDFIDENLHKTLESKDIAGAINVSQDRLRHLFADHMGIPIAQYVLWQRIRRTLAVAVKEESKLNEACARFGFTDQPHFNKTFKRIFGLTPAHVVKHSRVLI